MFEFVGDQAPIVNWIFLAVTAAVAWHAIRFRDKAGRPDYIHLLIGSNAAVFFFLVLFQDVLGIVTF